MSILETFDNQAARKIWNSEQTGSLRLMPFNYAGYSSAACDEQRDEAGSPTSHERGVVKGEDTPEDEPSDWPVGVHLAAEGYDPQTLGERERAIRADSHQRFRVGADLVGF